jgi:hypothetical protein
MRLMEFQGRDKDKGEVGILPQLAEESRVYHSGYQVHYSSSIGVFYRSSRKGQG